MFEKLKAFTLAEALVVIVIIGVIAAISLPILKSNYLSKTYHAGLKKNYYVLKTALERYELDNFRKIKGTITKDIVDKLVPYLNVHKVCAPTGEEGEGLCPLATEYESYSEKGGKYPDSWKQTLYKYGAIVLNDSSLIMVGQGPNLGLQGIGNTEFVYIDVNGYGKGPNRMGEDLYAFILTNIGELIPVGDKGTIYSSAFCDKNQGWSIDESGMSCSYEVLRNSK